MSLIKDAVFVDENGYARVGAAALHLRDFENEPVLCVGVGRDPEMDIWPVCAIQRANQWLVLFVARGAAAQSSVWQLEENGKCLAQHLPDAAVTRLLLGWAGCTASSEAAAVEGLSRACPPDWVTERFTLQARQGTQPLATSLRPVADVPDWLLAFLQPDLARLNSDIQGLIAWLDTSPRIAGKAGAIRRVWQQLCGQYLGRLERSTAFFDDLRNQAGYQLLREVIAAFIGRHILRCPFTGTYQLASHGRHITHYGPQGRATGGARVLRYDPAPGLWFHEIRGHGFLAQTDAVVTGGGLLFQPSLENAWSSWFTPAACARYPTLPPAADGNCMQDARPQVLVLNTSAGPNLGHLLWNDCSGLAGVLALVRAMPDEDFFRHWRLAFSPAQDLRFAREGPEAFMRHVLSRLATSGVHLGHEGRAEVLQYFDSDAALSAWLEKPDVIAISLKSLVVAPQLAAAFRAEAAQIPLPESLAQIAAPMPGTLRVFVNVRVHDKALLNIAECLMVAVERALMRGWPPQRFLFVLEGTEEASEKLDELSRVLMTRGASASIAVGLGVDRLGAVLSHCDVAIVPIGSGAVLPTWIYDLPTFLHADRAHMPQAGFWSHVGGSSEKLVVIDTSHIQDVEDRLYSSYVITPEIFADCFSRLIELWKALNP
jgi:hypothetical protein